MKVQLVETEHIYLLVVSSFCIQIQVACGSTSVKILDFRSSTREVYFDCCKWNIRKSKPEEYKLIEERVNCWWSEGGGDGGLKSSHMLEHLHGQRQLLTCCLQPQPQCLFFFFSCKSLVVWATVKTPPLRRQPPELTSHCSETCSLLHGLGLQRKASGKVIQKLQELISWFNFVSIRDLLSQRNFPSWSCVIIYIYVRMYFHHYFISRISNKGMNLTLNSVVVTYSRKGSMEANLTSCNSTRRRAESCVWLWTTPGTRGHLSEGQLCRKGPGVLLDTRLDRNQQYCCCTWKILSVQMTFPLEKFKIINLL